MTELSGVEEHVPKRLQLPMDEGFRDDYLAMTAANQRAGVNVADLLRELVRLSNEDPVVVVRDEHGQHREVSLREELDHRARRSAAQRQAAANRARSRARSIRSQRDAP